MHETSPPRRSPERPDPPVRARHAVPAVVVGLGELRVVRAGELVASSLGSCVGICLYEPLERVAAMAHVVLPVAPACGPGPFPGKFADTAVPALLAALEREGAQRALLGCKLVGGAAVLVVEGDASPFSIGRRNLEAVKEALAIARLPVLAEATGGTVGRSARLDAATGRVVVRTIRGAEAEL